MLREHKFKISYWENEENWATIIVNGEPIGYLWKKYPVLFIENDYLLQITRLSNKFEFLSIITVEGLNSEIFKMDYNVLAEYFDYGVDYERFSATDLWFHTNSI